MSQWSQSPIARITFTLVTAMLIAVVINNNNNKISNFYSNCYSVSEQAFLGGRTKHWKWGEG